MAPLMMKNTENSRITPISLQKPLLVSPEVVHVSKSTVPPKPTPSPRSKPWRPRSGSAGSTTASNGVVSPVRLDQPYPLDLSKSSLPKPHPVTPESHTGARGRSFSSSAVSSFSSDNRNASSRDTMHALMSNLSMRRHKYGETHPKVGASWNRIGNFFFSACQYTHALDAFKHAVACYPVGETLLASKYSNMGATYWASGRPDKAIGFLQKALDLYEINEIANGRDPDESLAVASVLYQMGLCHTLMRQYGDAMTCLKKCQKIQGTMLAPMDIQVGRTLDAIGKVHFFREEYSTSLECHEEARRIKAASCENDPTVITSLLNIAAVHHATKNWNVALIKYTKVLHLQRSELVRLRSQKEQPLLARIAQEVGETLQLLGDMHVQMDQGGKARRFFQEALLVYEEAGLVEDDPRIQALRHA